MKLFSHRRAADNAAALARLESLSRDGSGGVPKVQSVGEDGTYTMNYTTWNGNRDTLSVATSRDLIHWRKHGPAVRKAAPKKV